MEEITHPRNRQPKTDYRQGYNCLSFLTQHTRKKILHKNEREQKIAICPPPTTLTKMHYPSCNTCIEQEWREEIQRVASMRPGTKPARVSNWLYHRALLMKL